jgi:hypothetical protein
MRDPDHCCQPYMIDDKNYKSCYCKAGGAHANEDFCKCSDLDKLNQYNLRCYCSVP